MAIKALVAAEDPVDGLDAARQLREAADELEAAAVRSARAGGVSWSRIGKVYGTSKQGAQQRFGKVKATKSA